MKIEDKHIIQIAKGEIHVFKSFFDQFYPALCNFCYQILKSEDVATDIAQEAMVEFWINRRTQSSVRQSKVYLYTIAKNKSLNNLRKRRIEDSYALTKQEESSDDIINIAYIEDEVYSILSKAINNLPKQSQKIIQLTLKDYRNNEIAEELNISINTVKTLKKRAYKKLRELLKDHMVILMFIYCKLFF